MSELEPFYKPLDDPGGTRFYATFSTTGPWFADAQHLGPPTALLIRALERCPQSRPDTAPMELSRITVEVLGPVPAAEVSVHAQLERPGRTIELLAAEMTAGGRAVLRARAWRLAAGDTAAVAVGHAEPLPGPEKAATRSERPDGWLPGFMDAMEWRFFRGSLGTPGPGVAWMRQRVPLIDGEEPSALQRLAVVADSANGVAAVLDMRQWLFVNTELTIHLHRPPTGEWIGLDAATVVGPRGCGTVAATLFDGSGHVGRVAQSLTIRPR
ncbi:thioesterase family protein [Pseudonocardia hispaniensis]|uniref:Thioesterase family protein n=1 Tax=Pseudonocardia hispaniensis TaxID=904933 RepID=A0ABW1J2P7_9PSEU